jgi:sarcosine oxidase subunit beta
MSSSFDVVVIGGGVTGAATAYYLALSGAGRVLLAERGQLASGGTGKSAAIVRQHYSTRLMARLAHASMHIFETMADEFGAAGAFHQTGWLMLVPPKFMEAAQKNIEDQRSVGVETGFVPASEWEAAFPWLNPEGLGGIVREPFGGHADPIRVTEAYVAAFQALGGEVRLRTPCRAILRDGDRVTGGLFDDGAVAAGTVINAAGPWSRALAEAAGIEMQMRAVREQDTIWEARPGRPIPTTPVSNAADAIYSVPQGEGRMLIGQGFPKEYFDVDPNNYKETSDDEFVSLMVERATARIPTLEGMRLVSSYAALYDVTPDWYPFIGPRKGLSGYVDASGGSGHGFKIAPAIARELARWIVEDTVADDFAGLSYDRLAEGRTFVGSYGGNRG